MEPNTLLLTDRRWDAEYALIRAYRFIRNAAYDDGRRGDEAAVVATLTDIARSTLYRVTPDEERTYASAVRAGDMDALIAFIVDQTRYGPETTLDAINEAWNEAEYHAGRAGWTLYAPDADALIAVNTSPEAEYIEEHADGTWTYHYKNEGFVVEWNGSRTWNVYDAYTGEALHAVEAFHGDPEPPRSDIAMLTARDVAYDVLTGALG
mgnify:CR=1 FL=1